MNALKEALLYEKLPGDSVRCDVCRIRCVIPEGGRGSCHTRLNRGGTLYSLVYGLASSVCADPVEKKPLYHFHPGTTVLSLGTLGCNFRCPGCQNHGISQLAPAETGAGLQRLSPEQSVEMAVRHGCQGICWTYNEPTIWLEQALETARLAKARGLYTAYVTNGFITPEALDALGPYLDAFRVDIKAFSRAAHKALTGIADYEGVLESAARARRQWNMHVECITNVTPTLNDDPAMLRAIARWIREELGAHTPWHVTRFYPHRDLAHLPPTPVATLESAYAIAHEEGLAYVYVGNLPGNPAEDTRCPSCGTRVIRRSGMAVLAVTLVNGACPHCGTAIPGRFADGTEHAGSGSHWR